jgi:nucleotide-binding universal stress UspA family protein
MKAILLPTDFSENSINAINYAMSLFVDENCEFYVVNIQKASSFVTDDLMTMSSSATVYNTIIDASKKSLNNLISTIEKKYKNKKHNFHSMVDYDNFVDAINQISEEKNIDQIIMGTKGATGASKVIFGSNTVRIMQRCNTPVLAIPDNCTYTQLDNIAFTSNYSTMYSIDQLQPLLNIAKLYNSKIKVLHLTSNNALSQDQDNNRKILDSSLGNISHEFIDLESDDIFKTVQDYLGKNNIKMLAMMSRKHSFLERLFARHLVETFAFKIDVPFLVMENSS